MYTIDILVKPINTAKTCWPIDNKRAYSASNNNNNNNNNNK